MCRTFQCGCIVDDEQNIKFCKDHWIDMIVTGNVVYPKDGDGNVFLIKDSEIINPFGHSIFSDMEQLKLK